MYQVEERPTAFITVNKGRRKIKDGKFVYLQNGQEFEIELFNPTSQVVLAKIQMNGKAISSSGIVLRPGERVYLERFLDDSQKFLFDTYEVSGKDSSVQKAIEKNGLVRVDFYNEDTTIVVNSSPNVNIRTPWPNQNSHIYTYYNNTVGDDLTFGTTSVSSTYTSDNTSLSLDDTLGFTPNEVKTSQPRRMKSKKVETGRVEKGSVSNQTFQTVDKKFYSYTTATVEYQIKPVSQMRMTAKQAVTSTKYCTNCGKKAKYTHKFCANCGTKL